MVFLGENESKESNLSELKLKLNDDVTALKNLGEKCDQLNLKYIKKSEEFAPQHIRVSYISNQIEFKILFIILLFIGTSSNSCFEFRYGLRKTCRAIFKWKNRCSNIPE